jgi:uncharacterized membrane protein
MAKTIFTEVQKQALTAAVGEAESHTSGEIRVHLENRCEEDVLDRAAFIFEKLQMHKTKLRNGVLFYVSFEDQKLAILGDIGINAKVGEDFWESTKVHMVKRFKEGAYAEGLSEAVVMAGKALRTHFPKGNQNPNELSNEISYGDSDQKK